MPKLAELNALDQGEFTRVVGPVFEHSPWIATRAWAERPFVSSDELHEKLCHVVTGAPSSEKLALIRAHPDLADRIALTAESQGEQSSAGLRELSETEHAAFRDRNREYREQFGFPFVICARLNDKQAMLEAFAARLQNSQEIELKTALNEIFRIAKLRLSDLIE